MQATLTHIKHRPMTLLAVFTLIVAFVVPLSVSAQDDEYTQVFDLSETFTVTDLNFTFPYPTGWVVDTSDGITIAETEADLAATIDDDETTFAEGYVIQLNGLSINDLEGMLDIETAQVDEYAALVAELGGVEVSETFENIVLAHRAAMFAGVSTENGRPGIGSVWIQDGVLVVFSISTGDTLTSDLAYTWGVLLGSARAIPGVDLDATYEVTDFGFSIDYPADWSVVEDETGIRIYELESDAANDDGPEAPEGIAFGLIFSTVEELGIEQPVYSDLFDLAPLVLSPVETYSTEELVVLGTPGVAVNGIDETDMGVISGIFSNEATGQVVLYAVITPDIVTLADFLSTSYAMLQSITELGAEDDSK